MTVIWTVTLAWIAGSFPLSILIGKCIRGSGRASAVQALPQEPPVVRQLAGVR